MPYTPVELRHVRLGRALFGYKREETEQLLSATLVAAERAAAEAREAARCEADLIVSEAHQEARSVMRGAHGERERLVAETRDRKSTRLNSSHEWISYAVFCLK